MAFAVIATANHYLLDVVAGGTVALVGLAGEPAPRASPRRPGPAPRMSCGPSSSRTGPGTPPTRCGPPGRPARTSPRPTSTCSADDSRCGTPRRSGPCLALGELVPPRSRRAGPDLAEILAAVSQAPGLVLDLKGPDPRLPAALLASLAEEGVPPGAWICGRVWRTIDRLRGTAGLRTLNSVGSRAQLRLLLRRYGPGSLEGVSIRLDLLTPGVADALRVRADALWTWPVNDLETADLLADWGVTGMVSDYPGRLRRG